MRTIKILVVDDEPDILEFLKYNLNKENFVVFTASGGVEGLKTAKKELPDLIILDIMMSDLDGIEVCHQLKKMQQFNNTIIIFLTARGESYSEIAGFDAGADDYIKKPIRPNVFVSKIKAILRRYSGKQNKINEVEANDSDMFIDKEKYLIIKKGKNIVLPKKEFELVSLLASKPGKLFTREDIYNNIWANEIVGDRTIDVHISNLRKKIGENYIQTLKGVGYKFID